MLRFIYVGSFGFISFFFHLKICMKGKICMHTESDGHLNEAKRYTEQIIETMQRVSPRIKNEFTRETFFSFLFYCCYQNVRYKD